MSSTTQPTPRGAFVYFMQHASEPRIKIGKAVDIGKRWRTMGAEFDLARSFFKPCASEQAAIELERRLHHAFRGQRVAVEKADGYTEWFKEWVIDPVVELVGGVERIETLASETRPIRPRKPRTPRKVDTRCLHWPYEVRKLIAAAVAECKVSFLNERRLLLVGPASAHHADVIGCSSVRMDTQKMVGFFCVFGGTATTDDPDTNIVLIADPAFNHLFADIIEEGNSR